MKLTYLLILSFCTLTIWGQDSTYYQYNALIMEAKSYSDSTDYKNALKSYDKAFKLIDCVPFNYFDAFETAVNDSNYYRANRYLIKGTLKGLDLSLLYSKEVELFNKSQYAHAFWHLKDSLVNQHFTSIDSSFYNALDQMVQLDQAARNNNIANYHENKHLVDSLNFEKLLALSIEKGFPTFEKTGIGSNKAFLLLWHHRGESYPNSEQWQRIIPLINKEIKRGTLDPNFFKMFDAYQY